MNSVKKDCVLVLTRKERVSTNSGARISRHSRLDRHKPASASRISAAIKAMKISLMFLIRVASGRVVEALPSILLVSEEMWSMK